MEDYLAQMYKVHGQFGLVGILFAFASAHQDVIFDVAKGFPEFFLFGPASTGKDQLFSCIKRMFGFNENDLTPIGAEISTNKGTVLGFAENMLLAATTHYELNQRNADNLLDDF